MHAHRHIHTHTHTHTHTHYYIYTKESWANSFCPTISISRPQLYLWLDPTTWHTHITLQNTNHIYSVWKNATNVTCVTVSSVVFEYQSVNSGSYTRQWLHVSWLSLQPFQCSSQRYVAHRGCPRYSTESSTVLGVSQTASLTVDVSPRLVSLHTCTIVLRILATQLIASCHMEETPPIMDDIVIILCEHAQKSVKPCALLKGNGRTWWVCLYFFLRPVRNKTDKHMADGLPLW